MSKVNINLATLAGGAFKEKVEEAFAQVAENIQDPNTEATKAREINIKIKIVPGKSRILSNVTITVATKLMAPEAIGTEMLIGTNAATGSMEVTEYDGSVIGQMRLEEEPDPEQDLEVDEETGEILSGGFKSLENGNGITDIRSIMNRS